MQFNFKPAKIFIFREFSVTPSEIELSITNDNKETKYVHRKGVLRNNSYEPIGLVEVIPVSQSKIDNSYFILEPESTIKFWITMDKSDFELAVPEQEYNVCLQIENKPAFCWMDMLADKIGLFKQFVAQPEKSSPELQETYELLLRDLPEQICQIPLVIQTLQESSDTLCMDFGTSYSVCAAFVSGKTPSSLVEAHDLETNAINFTMFRDQEDHLSKLEPTEMLLKKYYPDTKQAQWAYGHEARHLAKRNHGKGYLINLKSLMGDLDKFGTYYDLENNAATFKYEDILTSYLAHLTNVSKKHFGINFKNIHVSTPVLYTERQRIAYETVLNKIGFEKIETRLDEAKSPLYHFLSRQIDEYIHTGLEEKKTLSYFVIDCGGGSTDATLIKSIEISKANDGTGAIEFNFDNTTAIGNPFFGGQLLTLYLFKYIKYLMKIKILSDKEMGTKKYPVEQLLDYNDSNIFYSLYEEEEKTKKTKPDEVASKQVDFVYRDFEEQYNDIETLIPTRYSKYQQSDFEKYQHVRENFHIIWQLAEAIKIQIYTEDGPEEVTIKNLAEWQNCPGIWCRKDENTKFSLVKEAIEDISIKTYELDKIYRPIIFIEISRLFRDLKLGSRQLMDDSLFVRFVGQTTRIPLFDEALGYHLPRKMIEKERNKEKTGRFKAVKPEDKKLCTASGAAQYLRHVLSGRVTDRKFAKNEILLFDIYRFEDDAKTLRGEQALIGRGTNINESQGSYIRTQASQSEDFIGYKFHEYQSCLGTIEFNVKNLDREISDEEKIELENKHEDKWRKLGETNMLIVVKVENIGHAQRLSFYPYILNDGRYFCTSEPVQLKFQTESIFFAQNNVQSGDI